MAVNDMNVTAAFPPPNSSKQELVHKRAYVDSPAMDPSSLDVLRQFQANMATLEDLNGRLRYMMSEIRSLVRP
jgi:hypothetical protein